MRTKKVFKNYVATLAYMVVTLAVGLVTTPLILRYLGPIRMGAYRTMIDWFGYLGLLELGLGGSLRALLAKALGKSDDKGARQLLVAGFRSYLLAAFLMVLVGWFVAKHIAGVIPVSAEYREDLRAASLLFLLQFALVPTVVLKLLFEVKQEDYKIHFFLILQVLCTSSLAVYFASRNYGIVGQTGAVLLGLLPMAAYTLRRASVLYPGLWRSILALRVERPIYGSFWRLNRDTLVFDASGKISLLADNIVVAYFVGTASVVPLVITTRLIQIVQSALQAIGSASWAGLAQIHASGRLEHFNSRVIELTELIMVCAFAILGSVAAYNANFVGLWVGLDQYAGMHVSLLAGANAALLAVVSFWAWCFTGTGNVKHLTAGTALWAAVNLSASLISVRYFGVAGPLIGTLISYLTVSLWYFPRKMNRVFGTSARKLLTVALKPALLGVPFAAMVRWVSRSHDPGLWFLAEVCFFSSLYLAIYWFLFIDAQERKHWLEIPKRIFK